VIPPLALDDRTLELIHHLVDGDATDAERAELEAIISRSPRVGQALEAFRKLDSQLAAVPLADAPPALKPVVMASIRARSAAAPVVSIHRRPRPSVRMLAVAAALVIAVGLGLFLATRTSVRPSEATAVMGGVDAGEWTSLGSASTGPAGARFTLQIGRRGDRLRVRSESESGAPVTISWDDKRFQLEETSAPDPVATTESGVAFGSGVTAHAIVLRKKDGGSGRAVIRLEAGGREVLRRSVSVP
jgi:hypothetical protein